MRKLNNRGQGLVEYIFIVALMGVGTMAVLRHLSKDVNQKMAQISDAIQGRQVRQNSSDKIDSKVLGKKDMSDFFRQVSKQESQK